MAPPQITGDYCKGSCWLFPLIPSASWLSLALPHVALHDMLCLLFLIVCEIDKLLPSVQSFPCLHVLLKEAPGTPKTEDNLELDREYMSTVDLTSNCEF